MKLTHHGVESHAQPRLDGSVRERRQAKRLHQIRLALHKDSLDELPSKPHPIPS